MDYKQLLQHSYETTMRLDGGAQSRLAYLSRYIFDFITYDDAMDELFAQKAVEVCEAINDKKTFDYIAGQENYRWFLLMCNMPFFASRIEWGTSIRGAWWSVPRWSVFQSSGLWEGDTQLTELEVIWEDFIRAVVSFASSK